MHSTMSNRQTNRQRDGSANKRWQKAIGSCQCVGTTRFSNLIHLSPSSSSPSHFSLFPPRFHYSPHFSTYTWRVLILLPPLNMPFPPSPSSPSALERQTLLTEEEKHTQHGVDAVPSPIIALLPVDPIVGPLNTFVKLYVEHVHVWVISAIHQRWLNYVIYSLFIPIFIVHFANYFQKLHRKRRRQQRC